MFYSWKHLQMHCIIKIHYSLILQKFVLIQRRIFHIVTLQLVVCLFKEKYTIIWFFFFLETLGKFVSFPATTAYVHTHTNMCMNKYNLQVEAVEAHFPWVGRRGIVLADIHIIIYIIYIYYFNNDVRVPHTFLVNNLKYLISKCVIFNESIFILANKYPC